jgi:hypothetical protein
MRKSILTALAATAIALPSVAMAAVVFDSVGDSTTINIGGDQPGTSSTLFLQLTSLDANGDSTTGDLKFNYTLTNTGDTALNPGGRVSGFGFSTDPNLSGGAVTGDYTNITTTPAGGQIADVEVCFSNANGNGCSGSGGATVGDPATGTLTLALAGGSTAITLDDFGVRYQTLGLDGEGSGRGYEVPGAVPEPGTWAMMLLGFGGIGFAMRRRRRSGALAPQVA